MKAVSPIFEDRGNRDSYLLALTFVLILGLCTLIAYTAFAATEADMEEYTIKRTGGPATICSLIISVPSRFLFFKTTKYIEGTVIYHGINLQNKSFDDIAALRFMDTSGLKITTELLIEPDSNPSSVSLICPYKDGEIGISLSNKEKIKELVKELAAKKISM